MPDSKITALTSISTSTDPANDPLVIVDVSDTSMAATGTTKKVTLNQLLGASGTATLASATITGDLTVDTSTLKVDSANNRVGVGTASPSVALDVVGAARFVAAAAGPKLSIESAGGSTRFKSTDTSSFYYSAYDHNFTNTDGSVNRYTIDNNGVSTWYVGGSTAMTLNSTGLGVGGSPATKLDVRGATNASQATFSGTAGRGLLISTRSDSLADDRTVILNAQHSTGAQGQLVLQTVGTDRLLIDSSGQVGIGVQPSAWASIYKTIEFANGSSIWGQTDIPQLSLQTNAFLNSSFQWIYKTTAAASNYRQNAGAHLWFNAPSGTAGTAITFTQAMTLDASGNLLVGKTATNYLTVGCELKPNGAFQSTQSGSTNANTCWDTYSTGAGAYRFYVGMAGTVFATNTTISAISDARFKENVQDIDVGLGAILALKPRKFDWKDGKGKNIKGDRGFIAQEFETVFPNLIDEWKENAPEGEAPYKSVRQDLIPVLVKAIQELTAEVNALKNA